VQDNREYRQQQSNSGRTVGVPIRPNKRQRRTHEKKKKKKGGRERTNETKRKGSRKQGRIKKKTRGGERERERDQERQKIERIRKATELNGELRTEASSSWQHSCHTRPGAAVAKRSDIDFMD
jgi:hypothetical protein